MWMHQTRQAERAHVAGKVTNNLYYNDNLSSRLQVQRTLRKIDKAPDRRHWSSTPLAVNAFYGPTNNGLWIPAGILQSPFFDSRNEDARNYGSIGAILGHEM
jgi:putative endopeptidase